MRDPEASIVQLARLTLEGRGVEVAALLRRTLATIQKSRPDLKSQIREIAPLLASSPARGIVHRPLPVDADTRLELLRREVIKEITPEPVWPPEVFEVLDAMLAERDRADELAAAGIAPTKSLLFVGPPGVGKTLAARWVACRLALPLLTLDLAAVMSSFLGKTGNNIRTVLDFGRESPSVLLLDEFDSIAKRRDDATEVGELKRLVTVLLQAVDDWPADGVLIAATNHQELLDPAAWRRFDRTVLFPMPTAEQAGELVTRLLPEDVSREVSNLLGASLTRRSFADIQRMVHAAQRRSIVDRLPLEAAVIEAAASAAQAGSQEERLSVARILDSLGRNQREISELTGLARDTLRKHRVATRN